MSLGDVRLTTLAAALQVREQMFIKPHAD